MTVLYLTHRVPYAPDRGDRIRAFHTLRVLRDAGFRVYVLALAHDDEEERAAEALAPLAAGHDVVRVTTVRNRVRALVALPGPVPLTHVLLDSPALRPALGRALARWNPDAVLAFCSGIARVAIEPPLGGLPMVLDMVDVDSAKWSELAGHAAWPMRWIYAREAARLATFEARAMRAAAATVAVSPLEAALLEVLAPDARVIVAGNGVDLQSLGAPPAITRQRDVVFTAVFDYDPNVQGAVWLTREVWPLVRRHHPDARLLLVGARPTRTVRRLAADDQGVVVTGRVADVRPYLWTASVAVAPLAVARGTQNKVLEALAAGLPVVVTPAVLGGLPPSAIAGCRVATAAPAFADAVVQALHEAGTPRARSAAVLPTWAEALQPLVDVLRELGTRGTALES